MKKEIPILFSAPMVEAIMDGRKKQTRRVIKQLPPETFIHYLFEKDGKHYKRESVNGCVELGFKCPYGKPGDILWVRETFCHYTTDTGFEIPGTFRYKTDNNITSEEKWKPSIHMPKAAARIWLEVTDVRVERLQDINPNDACLEGVEYWNIDHDALEGGELQAEFKNYMWIDNEKHNEYAFPTYANSVDSFRTLWQSINGPESWEANPWVWVVSFNVLSKTGKPEIS